jgi:hypothetical protein
METNMQKGKDEPTIKRIEEKGKEKETEGETDGGRNRLKQKHDGSWTLGIASTSSVGVLMSAESSFDLSEVRLNTPWDARIVCTYV